VSKDILEHALRLTSGDRNSPRKRVSMLKRGEPVNHSPILTKPEAAEYIRCTARYLERQVRAGRLRALKPTGKFVRFFRRDLDAFLESGASIA
jgi:excisionase family DNA binding protein